MTLTIVQPLRGSTVYLNVLTFSGPWPKWSALQRLTRPEVAGTATRPLVENALELKAGSEMLLTLSYSHDEVRLGCDKCYERFPLQARAFSVTLRRR